MRSSLRGWDAFLAVLWASGGLLVALLINYHSYFSDFNLVPGDQGDSRLVVFVLEHWYRVFGGHEGIFALGIFYPDAHALAYADGLFLFGIPYSMARLIGSDPFTAYQLTLAFATAVGYLAWILVLQGPLKVRWPMAAAASVLLSSFNALQVRTDIGKLIAVNMYPILFAMLWGFARGDERRPWKPLLCILAFAMGLALLFFTSYYPAWFFAFSLSVFGTLYAAVSLSAHGPRNTWTSIENFTKKRGLQLGLAALAFVIAFVPFLMTYLPLIQSQTARGWDLVLSFSPRAWDLLNVSGTNLVWSPILRWLGFDFGNLEVQVGSPLLVLAVFGAAVAGLLVQLRARGWKRLTGRQRMLLMSAATAVVLTALSVRIGDFSLWYVVYKIVPGASALRALGRILMVIDIIVILVAVSELDSWLTRREGGHHGRMPKTLLAIVVVTGLLAEEINGVQFRLEKDKQLTLLRRFDAPSVPCQAFFLENSVRSDKPFGWYQLDAAMVGMNLGIPTVNGYSGFEPHPAFTLPTSGIEYHYRVLDWLLSRGVNDGICSLDFQSGTFRRVQPIAEYAATKQLYRSHLLQVFTGMVDAATRFIAAGGELSDLSPENLEKQNYLDAAMGFEGGNRQRWIDGRYWIGTRSCGKKQCFGIGIVGAYEDLKAIMRMYGPGANRVYFPYPQELDLSAPPADSSSGEALFLFDVPVSP